MRDVFPENTDIDIDGRGRKDIDPRMECDAWRGVFERIGSTNKRHNRTPVRWKTEQQVSPPVKSVGWQAKRQTATVKVQRSGLQSPRTVSSQQEEGSNLPLSPRARRLQRRVCQPKINHEAELAQIDEQIEETKARCAVVVC